MKPILIVPKGQMDAESIKLLNENDICTVEAVDPSKIKFVDPIPSISSRTEIENACIKLSRYLFNTRASNGSENYSIDKSAIVIKYMEFLSKGTPLDVQGTRQEQDQGFFDQVKRDELDKLAREEAKAERAAIKAQKEESKKKETK